MENEILNELEQLGFSEILTGPTAIYFAVILAIIVSCLIAFIVVDIIANVKFFKKIGLRGWECIVPFYNHYAMSNAVGLDVYWFIMLIAPFAAEIIHIDAIGAIALIAARIAYFAVFTNFCKRCKTSNGLAVLSIFLPEIAIMVAGFGKKYAYDASIEVSKNGPF